jgi:hypothetical protein
MGWKGTIRSMGAAVRRAERARQRQLRELERRQRQEQKLLDQELAKIEVANYEHYLERLMSIHTEIGEPIDWSGTLDLPEPKKPVKTHFYENEAQRLLESYSPGIFDKLFKRQEAKMASLREDVEAAKARDESDFETASHRYSEEMTEWTEKRELAKRILECDPTACLEVLKELGTFHEIADLGSRLNLSIDDKNPATIHIELDVLSETIIPKEKKTLLKSGKVSTKQLPKREFYGIFQDYVCSCCLRIAGEIFATLAMAVVNITAMDKILNTKTGHVERLPILSVVIPRSTFEGLNLAAIDPSDSMDNFLHRMNFVQTKGFKPVLAFTDEDLPASLRNLEPPDWC